MNRATITGTVSVGVAVRQFRSREGELATWQMSVDRMPKERYVSYVHCVAFGELVDQASRVATKGARLLVDGRITQASWRGPDGKKIYRIHIDAIYLRELAGAQERPELRKSNPQEADATPASAGDEHNMIGPCESLEQEGERQPPGDSQP